MAHLQQLAKTTLILSIIFLMLPACQLIKHQVKSTVSYGEYYLTLQQLNQQQLSDEITKQKTNAEQQKANNIGHDYDPQLKLLLLYSLPKSPIYNSFNAKALLNEMLSEENNIALATLNLNDQAFIAILRDQLNQRLLMRNRLLAQQQQLVQQVRILEQTIKQLKNIEQAIDNREQ